MKWTSPICFKVFWNVIIRKQQNAGVVPENVRVKRSKMMRGLSVKNAFYESQLGSTRTVLFESENKGVTFMVLQKTT
jgi:hypothetical protein